MLGPAFSSTDLKRVEVWLEPRLNIEELPQLSSDIIEDMLKHLQRTGLYPAKYHCNEACALHQQLLLDQPRIVVWMDNTCRPLPTSEHLHGMCCMILSS